MARIRRTANASQKKQQGRTEAESGVGKSTDRQTPAKTHTNRNKDTQRKKTTSKSRRKGKPLKSPDEKHSNKRICVYCRLSMGQSQLCFYIRHLQNHRRLLYYPKSIQRRSSRNIPSFPRMAAPRKKFWQPSVESCRVCQKVNEFTDYKSLRKHEREHEGHDLFQCRICRRRFFWLCFAIKHEFTHFKVDKKQLSTCQPCSSGGYEEGVTKDSLSDRLKGPRNTGRNKIGRLGCPRKIKSVLKGHLKRPCEICGKVFDKHYLKEHMTVHIKEKIYKCDICDRAFKWAKTHEQHIKSHNSELKTDSDKTMCSKCGKTFSRRSYLNPHERLYCSGTLKRRAPMNTGIKRKLTDCQITFRCSLCPKEFVGKHYLAKHMKCHTSPLSMMCVICGKSYSSQNNLQRHMLSHKGNNQPFQCSFCEARFTQNSSRKAHERSHTGEKPYTCKFCLKGFTQNSNRHTHEKRCKCRKDMNDTVVI